MLVPFKQIVRDIYLFLENHLLNTFLKVCFSFLIIFFKLASLLIVNDETMMREIDAVVREIEENAGDGEMAEYFRRTEEEMLNFLAVPEPFRDDMNTPHISNPSYARDCGCFECQPIAVYGGNDFGAGSDFDPGNMQDVNVDNLVYEGNENHEQLIFDEETIQFAPEVLRSNPEIQNENNIGGVLQDNEI